MIQTARKTVDRNQFDAFDYLSDSLRHGILQMLEARELADDVNGDAWDFAMEIASLQQGGIQTSQLRWLVCKGLIQHLQETTEHSAAHRSFSPIQSLSFCSTSCFVLTDAGRELALQLEALSDSYSSVESYMQTSQVEEPSPFWDSDLRELRLESRIIKRYRVPSPNQQAVLAAFEEEDWPRRVDDPLSPHPEIDPKRRLHDTIKSLNRHQVNPLLRFYGDGTGEGVRWGFVD